MIEMKAGEGTRTLNIQLGRLTPCNTSHYLQITCGRREPETRSSPRSSNAINTAPPELLVLLKAWDNLPQPIRLAIRAMLDSLDLPNRD